MKRWLQHAFALPSAEKFSPALAEAALVGRLTTELARRHWTLPATVMLESSRPLGFLTSQLMWSTYPLLAALTDATELKLLAGMLERPGAIDYLLEQLQAADTAVNVPNRETASD